MDKPKKEIVMDFDQYLLEKQDAFKKGVTDGYGFAMMAVTAYLKKGVHIKEFITGEYTPSWEPLIKALGRETEWNEFIEHRKQLGEQSKQPEQKEGEECQTP